MKKQLTSIILSSVMLMSTSAFAEKAPMTVKYSPANIPAAVYTEPYMESQFATVYAPWMRNFHLSSDNQIARGEYGGEACQQVRAAAQSPVNPDIMYFITNTSGIFVSKTDGERWYNCTNNSGGTDAAGLVCDLYDEATVYAHMRGVGVQRSRDYGRTWEKVIEDNESSVTKGQRTNTLTIDGKGNLYMALSHGIYTLNRETEELTKLWPQGEEILEAVPRWYDIKATSDGQHIYACQTRSAMPQGIWASHDGGKTWKLELAETEEKANRVLSIAFHPENESEIYITMLINDKVDANKSVPCALYRTTPEFKDLEFLTYHAFKDEDASGDISYKNFFALQFGPKNPDGIYPLYYCANQSSFVLRVSYDYGKTFSLVLKPKHRVGVDTARYPEYYKFTGWLYKQFIVDWSEPEGRVINFEAGPGEWLAKDDSYRWFSSGFSGASVTHMAVASTGKTFLSTTDVGAFIHQSGTYSENSYPTYQAYVKDSQSYKFVNAVFDPNDDNHIVGWVGINNGTKDYYGIRQSFDGGKTFDVPTDDRKIPVKEIHALRNTRVLQYDANDANTIYTTYWTSHDNGKTWEENEYYYLAVSQKTPGKILGMKGSGKTSELYLTEDGGKTWRYVCTPGTKGDYLGVAFDADERYVWYTEQKDLVKLDTERGTIESFIGKLSKYSAIKYLAQNPKDPKHILVTTRPAALTGKLHDDPKLWETRDGGKSWHAVPGLMGSEVHQPVFSTNTDEVFIGTMAGLFIYKYKEYWHYLDTKITIEIDGREVDYSEIPVIEGGRAMVPVRELFEDLGAKVSYNQKTGEITASRKGKYVSFYVGSTTAIVDGESVELDAAPYITAKGKTMIPIRLAAEVLDLSVGWSEDGRKVVINS